MSKKFICVPPLLRPGTHRVVLRSIEESASKIYSGQPAVTFSFACDTGMASRITGATLRQGEALHYTLSELAGRPIGAWESVCPDDFVGRHYEIDVAAKGDYGVVIEAIRPVTCE